MVMVKNGAEEEVGTLDDRVVIQDDGGTRAIIRVQNVDGPAGVMADSSIADAATLAPRRHNSQSERRILLLQFAGRHLTGTYREAGDPSFPIDEQVPDSIFDSNMLDVLVAAMPLRPGYSGRLMVYLYEVGGAAAMDVAVIGSGNIDGVDTWVTNVTLRGRTARYDVGKNDHRVVQIVSHAGPGVEVHLRRNAPLTR
jgi:hypothetical protein